METVKLGDVTVKIGSGATPRGGKSVYKPTGIALVRSQNVLDLEIRLDGLAFIDDQAAAKLASASVEHGDVLINITGDSTARVSYWGFDFPARVNQHVAVLRADKTRLNSRWLQYWLVQQCVKSRLLVLASSGGSRPALTKGMLSDLEVSLPTLSQQEKVALVLSSLDDKIAANKKVASLSRQLVRVIAETSDKRVPLDELAIRNKQTLSPKNLGDNYVMHYSIPSYDAGFPAVEPADSIKSNKMHVKRASVLVSKLNPETPRVWSIATPSEQLLSLASTEFVVLEPSGITQSQLYAATLHANFHHQLASLVGGTSKSHQRVRPEEMLACLVPDVRGLTHTQIGLLEALVHIEAQTTQEMETLAKTRDELLPLLMNGKISVREAKQEATSAGVGTPSEEIEA